MSANLSKDEKKAVKEIKQVLEKLPVGSEDWDWNKAAFPEKGVIAEQLNPGSKSMLQLLGHTFDMSTIGLEVAVVPGKNGQRDIIVANRASELIIACGGPVGACVSKEGIVIPTRRAEQELAAAAKRIPQNPDGTATAQESPDVLELFHITAEQMKKTKVQQAWKRSVMVHELEHANEPLLDKARVDLFAKSEWSAFRKQADYLNKTLGTPKVSDEAILGFLGRSYGLGISYIRSVLECYENRPDLQKAWLPGGAEFEKMFTFAKQQLAVWAKDPRFEDFHPQFERRLAEFKQKPFEQTAMGVELRMGVQLHYQRQFFRDYAKANPRADLKDRKLIEESVRFAGEQASKVKFE